MRTPTNDNIMHLLAEHHGERFLKLIGITPPADPRPTKLPAEVVDPDLIWDLGDQLINLEMETKMGPDMTWRLFDYRARLRLIPELRDRPLHQHVLVLDTGSPPDQPRATISAGTITVHDHKQAQLTYHVHLLRNTNPDDLLADPITAVLAPLARAKSTTERIEILRRAATVITTSSDASLTHTDRQRLLTCLGLLASIRLGDPTIITTTIQETTTMPIDLANSSIVTNARAEGRAEGRIMGMLELQFGKDPRITPELAAKLADGPDPTTTITQATTLDDLLG